MDIEKIKSEIKKRKKSKKGSYDWFVSKELKKIVKMGDHYREYQRCFLVIKKEIINEVLKIIA